MHIAIFGANGPTGRLLTSRSLAAGHDVVALTRHPGAFPLADPRLRLVGGDVLDQAAVDGVVDGADAVLSTLGTPFTKQPVELYSRGVGNVLDAMKRFAVRRVVVVSSSAVTGEDVPGAGVFFNRVLQPYVMKRIGRTTYDDLRRMEALVSASEADWTILRPSGLFDLPAVTDYTLTAAHGPGRFTARADLADAMLRQVADDRYLRGVGYLVTTEANPSLLSLMVREAFKK
jgi:nucleoside-diphosphate-sugar epimerase